ncbi:NAD(P)-binding protein [Mycena crocata]|nr:NAD(P)-binding protein [Mycena crocata]
MKNAERDIPDLSGKITLVTGGNTGIGYETVKQLLLKNAKVYLAARSPEKAAAAIKKLEQETKRTAIFLQLDLADLSSVRKAAESYLAQESRLDILFNNGGVMNTRWRPEMALNPPVSRVAPNATPASQPPGAHESSHLASSAVLTSTNMTDSLYRKLYGQSKIGNIIISNYFARMHSDVLVSCALHPGNIRTELSRHSGLLLRTVANVFLASPPMGACTQLWGGTVAEADEINGKYLVPWGKVGKPDKRTADPELEEQMIAYIREQIKGF